jgi:hypothetical protein
LYNYSRYPVTRTPVRVLYFIGVHDTVIRLQSVLMAKDGRKGPPCSI